MMINFARFNIYLSLALALTMAAGSGCQTKKNKDKDMTLIELHQEVSQDGASDNESVPIFREHPIYVNVDKSAFLDTPDVIEAKVLDELGGFVIQLKFNWRGTQLLDAMTNANRKKRIAIRCIWGPSRWLASPVISRPITDGTLTFTPDASREEADRIVKGLNEVAAKLKKEEKL
jgi:preprotein translocase subunit SecD